MFDAAFLLGHVNSTPYINNILDTFETVTITSTLFLYMSAFIYLIPLPPEASSGTHEVVAYGIYALIVCVFIIFLFAIYSEFYGIGGRKNEEYESVMTAMEQVQAWLFEKDSQPAARLWGQSVEHDTTDLRKSIRAMYALLSMDIEDDDDEENAPEDDLKKNMARRKSSLSRMKSIKGRKSQAAKSDKIRFQKKYSQQLLQWAVTAGDEGRKSLREVAFQINAFNGEDSAKNLTSLAAGQEEASPSKSTSNVALQLEQREEQRKELKGLESVVLSDSSDSDDGAK